MFTGHQWDGESGLYYAPHRYYSPFQARWTMPLPAQDRRVTLMQDHLYRTSVAHMAMGYGDNPPLTSYFIGEE